MSILIASCLHGKLRHLLHSLALLFVMPALVACVVPPVSQRGVAQPTLLGPQLRIEAVWSQPAILPVAAPPPTAVPTPTPCMDLATAAQSINPCEADGNELPICASPEPPAVDAHAGHMQMADSEATAVEARGVIYLTITNAGDSADTLTGIQSPVAAKAEIHQTTMDANGTMKMRQVEAPLEILPGAQLQFEPAGYHIMLLDLQQELKVGDRFPISLTFAQNGVITVESEVHLPTE